MAMTKAGCIVEASEAVSARVRTSNAIDHFILSWAVRQLHKLDIRP